MNNKKSVELFEESKKIMPGGVNSPVRAYKSVGLTPPFIAKGKGSRVSDVDGNEYIDYVGSWGPMILGHAREEVLEAIKAAADFGTSFGAPTERELILGQLICDAVPSIEMVRLVSSGTEAAMSAIRLSRGYTGRDKILKFEGCYHGHSDGLLVKAGSGALTMGTPDSKGIPRDFAKNTIVASYNDFQGVTEIFKAVGDELAAVIVEPIAANMGVVLPKPGFLELLRQLTHDYGALLIFDEVITGFRVSYGGAQKYYNVMPDLTVLGKIVGGGMPAAAYGGAKKIMSMISPDGGVYQAGTLSGNPLAVSAGIKTLEILKKNPQIYMELDEKGRRLHEGFARLSQKHGVSLSINRVGSLVGIFFTDNDVLDYKSAVLGDESLFTQYFSHMLRSRIYIAPSPFEAMFISHAHTEYDIGTTIEAIDGAFSGLK